MTKNRKVPDGFVDGNKRLAELNTRADTAAVNDMLAQIDEVERQHAMGLALIRQAANLTQTELAKELGVGQAAIAKLERRPDLLLSTLRSYIAAAGGTLRLVVELPGGDEVELSLDGAGKRSAKASEDSGHPRGLAAEEQREDSAVAR